MLKNEQISLDGIWNLTNERKTINIPIEIPGTISESLIKNKFIMDPFYGNNEYDIQKIYNEDWIFEKKFNIDKNLLQYSNIILQFNGIDTISKIELNNVIIGTSDNMFLRFEFDITDLIKSENNILRIYIRSPILAAKNYVKKFNINLKNSGGISGVPYLRKAQYSFGWDWGPCLPDIGIWKSVKIIFFDKIRLDSFYIDMDFKFNKDPNKIEDPKDYITLTIESVNLKILLNLNLSSKSFFSTKFDFRCKLISPDKIIYEKVIKINNDFPKIEFFIEYPYLWWTHDLGIPNLYDLEISIEHDGTIIDIKKEKVGIRDIQLIRKADRWGETFYFQLNGIPIFIKGANWIPIDSFITRGIKNGLIRRNLDYVLKANMNMIRVWGGGIYEDDLFYEICDERGVLVWQDLPFACAIYPIHHEFILNIKNEIIYNVKRLRNHPSLAIWCGNNEIEQLWKILLDFSNIKELQLINAYEKGYLVIFKELIPSLIKELDRRHQYWPSSPLDKFDQTTFLSLSSNNPESGDSHYWYVWHGGASFKSYRTFDSRFMSEFGFESFPSIKTIEMFCPPDQYQFDSLVMQNHQKNADGNKKILRYLKRRFKPSNFKNNIVLSQLTQAEAIEYGVEHWRRNRNECHCMGTLYWQLNDCWPVASWSSFDYYGRWKALHYYAKRFYNPLFPSVNENDDSVEFWITNDLKTIQSVVLLWKIYNSNSELLKEGKIQSVINPLSSKMVAVINVQDINYSTELRQNNIIFYKCKLEKVEGFLFYGVKLFEAPKNLKIENPKLHWELKKLIKKDEKELAVQVLIKSEGIALYVHIDSDLYDFIASDNYFSMEPNETRMIFIEELKEIKTQSKPVQIFNKKDFYIKSLYDLISE